MKSVNKVTLLGNIGSDPELKVTDQGMHILTFSLATNEKLKDGAEKTEWHRIVSFGKLAELGAQYFKKGNPMYIEGKIRYGSYENNGVKHHTTEVIANDVSMLGGK